MVKKLIKFIGYIILIVIITINIWLSYYISNNYQSYKKRLQEIKNNDTDYSTFDFEDGLYSKLYFGDVNETNKNNIFTNDYKILFDKKNNKLFINNFLDICENCLRFKVLDDENINYNFISLNSYNLNNIKKIINKDLIVKYDFDKNFDFNKPLYVFMNGKIIKVNLNEK